jgi:hypothetical protein
MVSLTIEQEQEYQRAKKVDQYLSNHSTDYAGFNPLITKAGSLSTKIGQLETLAGIKGIDSSGFTTEKHSAKSAVGVFYESVCGVCKSFLLEHGNEKMATNFSLTHSLIFNMPDGDVKPILTILNGWITDDLIPDPVFVGYGITAITIADGTALINAFVSKIGGASAVEADKSSVGIVIEKQLHDISTTIVSIALLTKNYIVSNSEFYNGFKAANKIDDIGIHHSGIRGHVNGAAPIGGAVIACAELKKSATSNLLGAYELVKMKPGIYEFTCTVSGQPILKQIIQIKPGKILEIDWQF